MAAEFCDCSEGTAGSNQGGAAEKREVPQVSGGTAGADGSICSETRALTVGQVFF